MAGNPDDKKISQLPENPVVLDTDEFSTITPRTDGSVGYENVKTPGWKLKDYVNTDPHVKGQATYASGDRAHPSIAHDGDTDTGIHFPLDDTMALTTAGVETITLDPHNNTIIGPQEYVPNNSRDGYLYLPTMDGSPTALPRQINYKTPIIIDRLNNVAFIFSSGAWRPLAGTGTGGGGGGAIVPTPVTRLDALDDVKATGANRPANGDALVYDTSSNSWKPARSGLEITIRPDKATAYPNPATLPVGHLILTIENGLKEIAVIDPSHRIDVLYSDEQLAAKVAASSLFQGVRPDKVELGKLPAPAPTNKGFYWTWTGPASTPIVPADFTNGGGFTATLQVGDWIQSDGVKFVHVPSDLMSKLRWKAVGSFQTWTDTSYEIDSLVVHNGRFYRATGAVTKGDPSPSAGGAWIDITPNYSLSSLLDADLTTPPTTGDAFIFDGVKWTAKPPLPAGTNDGEILTWDATLSEWVVSADYLGDESNVTFATDSNVGVPVYNEPANTFEVRRLNLEELADCQELSTAGDGDAPVWNAANNRWEPKKITSPILYLGSGAWNAADVADPAKNFGMATDTIPSPTDYPPQAGDQYIDILTGQITAFTGAATSAGSIRSVSGITGGSSPARADLVPTKLSELIDVDMTTPPVADQALVFDGTNWIPAAQIDAYTKTEVDARFTQVITGIEHEESVLAIVNAPPATPADVDTYIVGTVPTGDFAGHANALARWDVTLTDAGGALKPGWVFTSPRANEAHLVEDQDAIYHWSGAKWNKIASAAASSSTDKTGVGEIVAWPHETVPAEYVECSGQVVAVSAYPDLHAVIGNKYNAGTAADGTTTFALPDLRGYFLRGASTTLTVGTKHDWTTGKPKNAFTGTTNNPGDHTHAQNHGTDWSSGGGGDMHSGGYGNAQTGAAGAHSHTVNINGGGDAETAPDHFVVKWIIRWKGISQGARGPKGETGPAANKSSLFMVGDLKQSWLTETEFNKVLNDAGEPGKWVPADGRNVAGSDFAKITGLTNVPDLRGSYLRTAGQNTNGLTNWNGGTHRGYMDFATALPKTSFTGTAASAGVHNHVYNDPLTDNTSAGGNRGLTGAGHGGDEAFLHPGQSHTVDSSAHTHTVTINGGGDTETRPSTMSVLTFIKINN